MNELERKLPSTVACPFCAATDTELIALFGMQMMTSQYYCHECHSVFEAVKWTSQEEAGTERERGAA